MLTHFSLFTGIGGIDLSAEWAGFETVGQCEFADYPTKVLEKHWPDVPRWKDVRDVTIESIREQGIGQVTLLSGGFPCQPHSVAGKRLASADERDLWGEFARVIREVRPKWVLGENVAGLLSSESGRFFGRILRDLDSMGYCVGWSSIRASWTGAIHRRERIFIVAYSKCLRLQRNEQKQIQWIEHCSLQSDDREIENWIRLSNLYKPKLWRSSDGVSGWLDRLKCLGNAVVPQQVYPILKAIAEIELREE